MFNVDATQEAETKGVKTNKSWKEDKTNKDKKTEQTKGNKTNKDKETKQTQESSPHEKQGAPTLANQGVA